MAESLRAKAFLVESGTLGGRYAVPPSDGFFPVDVGSIEIEGHTEADVVIADLLSPPHASKPEVQDGVKYLWQHASKRMIDARPYGIFLNRDHFQRIFNHGGIFVVFADAPFEGDYVVTESHGGQLYSRPAPMTWSTWGLLAELRDFSKYFGIERGVGNEITITPGNDPLRMCLRRHLGSSQYTWFAEPAPDSSNVLAVNK